MSNPTSYTWNAVADITPPYIAQVIVLDAYTLRVIYSEPVVQAEAIITANYVIDNGLSVLGVVAENDISYIATTTQQTPAQTYTLTVSNLHDLNGISI